jgi:IPT/TIG domain
MSGGIRFRLGRGVLALLAVTSVLGGVFAALIATSAPAGAATLTPVISNEADIVNVAYDASGNLWLSEFNGDVKVLPVSSGTIFGQSVTAGQLTTITTLSDADGLAFDSSGDLFIADSKAGTVSVLSNTSHSIYGQPVAADTLTTLINGLAKPIGLTLDNNNLYIADATDVDVMPASSGTLFGTAVTANTLATLATGTTEAGFIAFDSSDNLYVSDVTGNEVYVMPQSSGTIFGVSATADTLNPLVAANNAAGLSFDASGNLYVDYYGNVGVLPVASGTINGTSVTANTFTQVATGLLGDLGNTYHSGNLYIADQLNESVDEMTTPTVTVSSVSFGGSSANPIVTVTGSGFNTTPATQPDSCPPNLGPEYPYGNLLLGDSTQTWGAGVPGDCIGINVAVLTSSEIVFGLGNGYTLGHYVLNAGDTYSLGVDGYTTTGTVAYTNGTATVTSVSPTSGPGAGGTAVTIRGTNFTGEEAVFVGGTPATNVDVVSATKITADTPPDAAATSPDDITVVTPTGVSAVGSADQFTYLAPHISKVTPKSGPGVGRQAITITGTNLQGASAVAFGATDGTHVSVNAAGTSLTVKNPAESAGTVSVTVTTPGGTSNGKNFTYLGPAITTLSPTKGSTGGGTTVTIHGTNLEGTTAVAFGSSNGTNVSVNAAGTLLTVKTPAESAGTVSVTVTTPGGTSNGLNYKFKA